MADKAEAPAVTIQSVIQEFMGDAERTAVQIAEEVRKRVNGARTTAKSVASTLCTLRKKHGVEAVPKRGGATGGRGYGLVAWLRTRLTSEGSNKAVAQEASEQFGRTVSPQSVSSYRSMFKRQGLEGLQPSRIAAAEDFAAAA